VFKPEVASSYGIDDSLYPMWRFKISSMNGAPLFGGVTRRIFKHTFSISITFCRLRETAPLRVECYDIGLYTLATSSTGLIKPPLFVQSVLWDSGWYRAASRRDAHETHGDRLFGVDFAGRCSALAPSDAGRTLPWPLAAICVGLETHFGSGRALSGVQRQQVRTGARSSRVGARDRDTRRSS
jgi:hypothetical protein